MPWKKYTAWLASGVLVLALTTPLVARAADTGRAWMGVFLQEYNDTLKEAMGRDQNGVLVSRVVPDGPAEAAGLRAGDLIVKIDGREVGSTDELTDLVNDARVGETLNLDYMRGSRWQSTTVTLGERPDSDTPRARDGDDNDDSPTPVPPAAPQAPRAPEAPEMPRMIMGDQKWMSDLRGQMRMPMVMGFQNRPRLGVQVQDVGGDMADALGVDRGVLVTEVMDDMPAKQAGIRAGDVITRIDGDAVGTTAELQRALRNSDDNRVTVELVRRGERRTVSATLQGPRTRRVRTESFNYSTPKRSSSSYNNDDTEQLKEEIRQLKEELRQMKEDMRR
jgi:C-terminal processing protease CtpA/Prc